MEKRHFLIIIIIRLLIFLLFSFFVNFFLLFKFFFLFLLFSFLKTCFHLVLKSTWRYQEAPRLDNIRVLDISWLSGNIVFLRIVLSIPQAFYLPLSK